jgi:uncharacterized membrane protein
MKAADFFTEQQKNAIVQSIANAELNTSGEVKVHIDNKCKGDVLDVAAEHFKKLKMHETELRNGVLFYLSINDRKFAILGDKGINEKVPADFWDTIRDVMVTHFKQQQFAEGLSKGIEMAGEKLRTHFPRQKNDINELSNELSFEK